MGCLEGLTLFLVCFTLFPSRVFCETADCNDVLHYCLLPKAGAHLILCANQTSIADDQQPHRRTLTVSDRTAFCKNGPPMSIDISPKFTSKIRRLGRGGHTVNLRCGPRSQFHNCTLRIHLIPASAIPNATLVYSGGRQVGDRASLTCAIAWKNPGTVLQYSWFKTEDDVFFKAVGNARPGASSFETLVVFSPLKRRHNATEYECGVAATVMFGLIDVWESQKFKLEVLPRTLEAVSTPNTTENGYAPAPSNSAINSGGNIPAVLPHVTIFTDRYVNVLGSDLPPTNPLRTQTLELLVLSQSLSPVTSKMDRSLTPLDRVASSSAKMFASVSSSSGKNSQTTVAQIIPVSRGARNDERVFSSFSLLFVFLSM